MDLFPEKVLLLHTRTLTFTPAENFCLYSVSWIVRVSFSFHLSYSASQKKQNRELSMFYHDLIRIIIICKT